MSFRNVSPSSDAFADFIQTMLDFKEAVENGEYTSGPMELGVPLTIGNVIIDTPVQADGSVSVTLTNAATGTTVTLVNIE